MGDHGPLTERLRALLADEPSTREVPMFGARAFLVNERMVVAVQRDGALLVRVDPARTDGLLARPGTRQAEMGAGRTMGAGWITVDADAIASDRDLSWWTGEALEHNRRASQV